jgi:hypothetical protein
MLRLLLLGRGLFGRGKGDGDEDLYGRNGMMRLGPRRRVLWKIDGGIALSGLGSAHNVGGDIR